MDHGILNKDCLGTLADRVRSSCVLYGPVQGDRGVSLEKVDRDAELALNYANFAMSPKDLFFPQSEVLCTFADDVAQPVPLPEERFVVFGMRPCDVQGLLRLDDVYAEMTPPDPAYMARRNNGTIVALACNSPCPTCFCTSVGGGPDERAGADVILFELPEALLFEACSDKGRSFLDGIDELLTAPTDSDRQARDEQMSSARENVPAVAATGVSEKLPGKFDAPMWEALSRICLNCCACTFSCPTCQCFGIYDESSGADGRRVRCWDACQLPLFTREASGHNPRGGNAQRLKQRVMHKFLYTVENFGHVSCMGCGRCVRNCPVNIDIREIIAEVAQ